MLGTLPSNYLKWVSKNLRARDFEEWAKLADDVLEDPVYRDRIEWEFAQKVLNGDVLSSRCVQQSAVSDLVEISRRFGWDNEDKVGWAKVDFGLLGTSSGGRIPRVPESGPTPRKDSGLEIGEPKVGENDNGPVEGRRKERLQRLKLRRKNSVGERNGIKVVDKGNFDNLGENKFDGDQDQDQDQNQNQKEVDDGGHGVDIKTKNSVFPGREALLKKALNWRRF